MGKLAACLLAGALALPAADVTLLDLAMPDARLLSGIRVAQIRSSPFGQYLFARFQAEGQHFENFVRSTGFDPRRDLDEILIATPGGAHDSPRLVVARGTFQPARILDLARNAGNAIAAHNGVDVVTFPGDHGNRLSGVNGIAFLSETLAVAGDIDSVHKAIDRRDRGPAPALAAKAGQLSAVLDAWFVSTVPVAEIAGRVPGEETAGRLNNDAFRSIEQASGGLKFGELVSLSLEVLTRTAEDASNLAAVIKFLSGMIQFKPQQEQARIASLLSSLDIKAEGNAVKLAASIPEQELESIIRGPLPGVDRPK
jgi:hypothetical protein